jgi:hypothetical protein
LLLSWKSGIHKHVSNRWVFILGLEVFRIKMWLLELFLHVEISPKPLIKLAIHSYYTS